MKILDDNLIFDIFKKADRIHLSERLTEDVAQQKLDSFSINIFLGRTHKKFSPYSLCL